MKRAFSTIFSRELFDYERPETRGEVLFFKLFELFIAVSVVQMAWSWGLYILRISDIVLPLGLANYVDVSLLFGNGLSLVNAACISVCVALGYFRVTRYAYLVAFVLLHLQFVTRFTQGEIPHSPNLVGMTLLGLGLAVLLFDDARYRRRFTFGFTYFFLGLGYTMAAVSKLVASGPLWSDGRHLWIWVHEKAVDAFAYSGVLEYNMVQELALSHVLFATALLTFGLLSELFSWLIWWRKTRTALLMAVIGLHVGIYAVMNIMFWHTFYELLLLALPWATWLDHGLQRVPRLASYTPRFLVE